jgi:D-apiose dehydrogenase
MRAAVIGCGFFARNHLHAWREVEGVELAAVCDLDPERARAAADGFGVPGCFTDAAMMIREAKPDFVDIAAPPAAHRPLVELAAREGVHVICQKPMALSLEDARAMVATCEAAGVRFMVHENFRWQRPMRVLREAARRIGDPFFARVYWRSAFDVFRDQPYLATDERFILADLGVHLLDLARFFMGEAETVYCRTQSVNPAVRGEDLATVTLGMKSGATCLVEMSYASRLPEEHFPQTLVDLESLAGSISLGADFRIQVVDSEGVEFLDATPATLGWDTPLVRHIQESVLRIQQHWVDCLREGREPETSGADNLKTLELVFASYDSAGKNEAVRLDAGTLSGE